MTKYSTDRRTEKRLCAHLHTRQGECGTTGQCISTFLAARYCRRLPERASLPTPERKKKQPLLENNVISNGQMRLIVHPPNSVSPSAETRRQHKPSDSPGRRRRALSRLPAGPVSPSESRRQNLADNPPRVQTTTKAKTLTELSSLTKSASFWLSEPMSPATSLGAEFFDPST